MQSIVDSHGGSIALAQAADGLMVNSVGSKRL
jgi:hypothetical protein